MNAQLILGCHGARRYGFSLCRGVSNPILDLRKLGKAEEPTMEYLDNHCKLFDKMAEDRNQIYNLINYIETNKLAPKHMVDVMYEFMASHKSCGFYAFIESIG